MPDKKVDTIGAAIARAQLTIKKAEKSSDNPYFKSKYAGLEEIIAVTRDALNKEGIAVLQVCDFTQERTILNDGDGNRVHYPRQDFITTKLVFGDQVVQSSMPLRSAKGDMQSLGSAITYARRYTLQSLLCVATDEPDDDGNAAVGDTAMQAKTNRRGNGAAKQEAAKASEFIK
jgi:hypothetical protein|tara:strand:- start:304 stop:825 length:522 start_codon:yes stop_codon:yes gene_type:complete